MTDVIDTSTSLAALVNERPELARELERRSLDYCCGGRQTLAAACIAVGLDPIEVADELAHVRVTGPAAWADLEPAALVDHDQAGALLASLREITDGYTVPADGCRSYVALYAGLAELEGDTHLHIHKENNLLFPAVVELEARATG